MLNLLELEMIMNNRELFFRPGCRVLIVGSSGAIGSAIVRNLKQMVRPEDVITVSRRENGLNFMEPSTIAFRSIEQGRPFHLILDATGALEINNAEPEKSFSVLDYETMLNQFKVNTVGPALLIKDFIKCLPRTGKAVFVTLSARVGSIEDNRLGGWISYRASKAALNQVLKTASIEASRKNPQSLFMAIHPGTVISELTQKYLGNHKFVLPDEAAKNILRVIEQKDHCDTGGFYAFDGKRIPY